MRLMHCPFCGEDERIRPFVFQRGSAWAGHVLCEACNMHGPEFETMGGRPGANTGACQAWNRRLPHDHDLALRVAFQMES